MPPLRERRTDIPLLVRHFIDKTCRLEGLPSKEISARALNRLSEHSWPGNVRQLEHGVEMAVALSGDRRTLDIDDFHELAYPEGPDIEDPPIELPDTGIDFHRTIEDIERSLVRQALAKSGGNKARAAGMLGMKRTTLISKMKAIGCLAS